MIRLIDFYPLGLILPIAIRSSLDIDFCLKIIGCLERITMAFKTIQCLERNPIILKRISVWIVQKFG